MPPLMCVNTYLCELFIVDPVLKNISFGWYWQNMPLQMPCVLAQQQVPGDSASDVGVFSCKELNTL